MRKPLWLTALAFATLTSLAGAQDPRVKLPDIGSSAASVMSPVEMRAYGASMLHEMRAYNYVLDDPLINAYLDNLGYRLVSMSDRPDQDFTFFIVRSNDINAFAAPGGYIGVNVGLINAMDSEDELAAVIAHEIAHVTQQHLLRAFEESKKSTLPIALAMLGALVATAGRSDDASEAALMSGVSLIQQRAINFTRYDEIEADRVGIQTLARAGFDPMAMADTFATMQRVMRVNGVDVPEFLRTHPIDVNRIADAKARAQNLEKPPTYAGPSTAPRKGDGLDLSLPDLKPPAASLRTGSDIDYQLMRERARTLNARSITDMVRYYADELKRDGDKAPLSNRYGHALALTLARQPAAAIDAFKPLLALQPDNPVFQLGMARAENDAGQKDAAFRRYEHLSETHPGNRAIALAFADALLARTDVESARRAQELIRPLLMRRTEDPDLQRSFARAAELAGDRIRAAEAYAEWAYLSGRAEDALNQLKALTSKEELTYYQRARIDARIAALTPIVLDQRKRQIGKPAGDEPDDIVARTASAWRCLDQACPDLSSRRNIRRLQ